MLVKSGGSCTPPNDPKMHVTPVVKAWLLVWTALSDRCLDTTSVPSGCAEFTDPLDCSVYSGMLGWVRSINHGYGADVDPYGHLQELPYGLLEELWPPFYRDKCPEPEANPSKIVGPLKHYDKHGTFAGWGAMEIKEDEDTATHEECQMDPHMPHTAFCTAGSPLPTLGCPAVVCSALSTHNIWKKRGYDLICSCPRYRVG